jgi:ketosteroid isomerase-like protein
MRPYAAVIGACGMAAALLASPVAVRAQSDDVTQIKALEDSFAAAFRAKDLDAIMKTYVPDDTLFVFDVDPPRQYVGFAAYKKDWQEFLGMFGGPLGFDITDLAITASGDLAYSHSVQHFVGKTKKGETMDVTVRVTDGYRKVNGHWLVTVEHVSVPVDLDTGKADLQSKP